jgi:hypothetical protein
VFLTALLFFIFCSPLTRAGNMRDPTRYYG